MSPGRGGLEAALLAPHSTAAAFGPAGLAFGTAATAATTTTATAAATTVRRPRVVGRRSRRSFGSILRLVDAEFAPSEFVLVESGDGLLRSGAIGELYEGEPSGSPRHPVGRDVNILDLTDFREEAFELRFCGFIIQVTDENCIADDCTPFPCCTHCWPRDAELRGSTI